MTMTDAEMVERLAGRFLVFDGPDGSGKSTQRAIFGDRLAAAGGTVVHCKDPGGTMFGDLIRSVLLDHDLSQMDVRCETLLFMASRAQLVSEIIGPALAKGSIVLCDRFISSTCAYQVAAGYDLARVLTLGQLAVEDTWPDLTIILDVSPEVGFNRTGRSPRHAGRNRRRDAGQGLLVDDAQPDAMEARPMAFHRRVREALLALPGKYPRPVAVIEGEGTAEQVHDRIWETTAGAAF
jgi:dTMP kinase